MQVACPYHGWQFNGAGECTHMPSTVMCKGVKVAHLPTVEEDGWVWVWGGDAEPVNIPRTTLPPSNFVLHSEIEVRPAATVLCCVACTRVHGVDELLVRCRQVPSHDEHFCLS